MSRLLFITQLIILLLTISFIPSVPIEASCPNFGIHSTSSEMIPPQNNTAFLILGFSEDVLLSTIDTEYPHHVEPTLAVGDDSTIFAGWKNANTHNGPGLRVSFSKSSDNGMTWTTPFDMPMFGELTTGQSDPWLVWHEGTIYYAYLEYSLTETPLTQITMSKSTDDGGTWTPVTASYGVGFADKETMTISSSGTVYVTYDDIYSASDDITAPTTVRLTRSTDGGNSFHERGVIADNLTHNGGHVGPYVITDDNENIYVAWTWLTENIWGDVYISVSQDQGTTFSQAIDLNPESENCTYTGTPDGRPKQVTLPVLRFDQNDRLYVLWAEKFEPSGTWDVYLRYSDDFALNWSRRYQINPVTGGDQWLPDMDIDSQGRLHVVWYDEQGNFYRPFYRTIVFSGESREEIIFSNPIEITRMNTPSRFTRPGDYFTIRVDSNDIPHVVWTDGREDEMDIYYSQGMLEEPLTSTPLTGMSWMGISMVLICLGILYYRKRKLRLLIASKS
ncbi:MAG: sialidase family protein [Candidatus Hermodarchaeota archaeon]